MDGDVCKPGEELEESTCSSAELAGDPDRLITTVTGMAAAVMVTGMVACA